jgi:hypothetical protein
MVARLEYLEENVHDGHVEYAHEEAHQDPLDEDGPGEGDLGSLEGVADDEKEHETQHDQSQACV